MIRDEQMKFFTEALATYAEKLDLTLLKRIESGHITTDEINSYLMQDVHYLDAFSDHLRNLAPKALSPDSRDLLLRHAQETDVWKVKTFRFVADTCSTRISVSAQTHTLRYIEHQRRSVEDGLAAGLASILPCYVFCPTFVSEITTAVTRSNASLEIRDFLSRFVDFLPKHESTCWEDEIIRVWREAIRVPGASGDCKALQNGFILSAEHELAMLQGSMSEARFPASGADLSNFIGDSDLVH